MTIKTIIDIQEPVTKVFQGLLTPENMPKWIEGFEKLQPIKGKRPRKGSVSNHIFRDTKGKLIVMETVLNYEKDKKFEILLSHKNMETNQSFELHSQGDITRLILTTNTRLIPAFMGIFSIFMKSQMKKQQETDLRKFKKLLEK